MLLSVLHRALCAELSKLRSLSARSHPIQIRMGSVLSNSLLQFLPSSLLRIDVRRLVYVDDDAA